MAMLLMFLTAVMAMVVTFFNYEEFSATQRTHATHARTHTHTHTRTNTHTFTVCTGGMLHRRTVTGMTERAGEVVLNFVFFLSKERRQNLKLLVARYFSYTKSKHNNISPIHIHTIHQTVQKCPYVPLQH